MEDTENPNKSVAPTRGPDGKFLPGNPGSNGRPPKEHCLSDLLYELLTGNPAEIQARWKAGETTGAMAVAMNWFNKLVKADMTALKEALDRVEGKVPQSLTGAEGRDLIPRPIVVEVETESAKKLVERIINPEAKTEKQ